MVPNLHPATKKSGFRIRTFSQLLQEFFEDANREFIQRQRLGTLNDGGGGEKSAEEAALTASPAASSLHLLAMLGEERRGSKIMPTSGADNQRGDSL